MTDVTLAIRYGARPLREARAWYIPGDDAAGWVREIAGWEVPQGSVRLYPVPRSLGDLRPRGVLAAVPNAPQSAVAGRCVPYGRVAGRLFLPVEARFDPDVAEAELEALLAEGYTYVWHPAVGLVGFEPPDTPTFLDVPQGHWAYSYVEYLASAGVVSGHEDGRYLPDGRCTRGQIAVYLARAFGLSPS